MNTLIVIGWLSVKTAYLNITREEAISRWTRANDGEIPDDEHVKQFTFDTEFGVYDAWES